MQARLLLLMCIVSWAIQGGLAEAAAQQRVTGTCPAGSSIRVINADGSVVCEVDDNSGGTVTSVGTGLGLTGGPITTTGTISVDTSQVQTRVGGICTAGSSIRQINADGSVVCETDDVGVTAVTASAPLLSSDGTTPNISLPEVIITANPPFGPGNTAVGTGALQSNTSGILNTATGGHALEANTTGQSNTASGAFALFRNTTGESNTANGLSALESNTTGGQNTAIGVDALQSNTTGQINTAIGAEVLVNNTTGERNTASGVFALHQSTAGNENVAIGFEALFNVTTGGHNTAIGTQAGFSQTTGFFNIYVGNFGVAGESGTIRIGGDQQNRAFVAGVSTTPVTGDSVFITPAGQLGVLASSRRFKEEIHDMSEASSGLLRLRPVTFRYKEGFADGARPVQYGLIAEEVAEVYPDLVVYSSTGEVESVQYHKLNAMLLNELQKHHRRLDALKAENADLKARLEALERLVLSKEAVAQK